MAAASSCQLQNNTMIQTRCDPSSVLCICLWYNSKLSTTSTALAAAHCLNRLKLHRQPQQPTALSKAVPLLNTCRHYFPNITADIAHKPERQRGNRSGSL